MIPIPIELTAAYTTLASNFGTVDGGLGREEKSYGILWPFGVIKINRNKRKKTRDYFIDTQETPVYNHQRFYNQII